MPIDRDDVVQQVLAYKKQLDLSEAHVRRLLDAYLAVAGRDDVIDWCVVGRAATDLDRAVRPFVGTMPELQHYLAFLKLCGEPAKRYDPARSLAAVFTKVLYRRPPPAKWPHHHEIACIFYGAFSGGVSDNLNLERECRAVRAFCDPRRIGTFEQTEMYQLDF